MMLLKWYHRMSHEQDARNLVISAKENLEVSLAQQEEDEKTMNVEIREKSTEKKVLKSDLRETKDEGEKDELQITLLMLEALITDLKNTYKLNKEKVKDCQVAYADAKKSSRLQDGKRKTRGINHC